MKEKILSLRSQGKTYREIENILGCSRSLISYYVNPLAKDKKQLRQNKNRFKKRTEYKNMLGGKCCICGYNKCFDALHFHHKDETLKKFTISDAIFNRHKTKLSDYEIIEEIKKCMLVCANCHHELHSQNSFN